MLLVVLLATSSHAVFIVLHANSKPDSQSMILCEHMLVCVCETEEEVRLFLWDSAAESRLSCLTQCKFNKWK